MDFGGTSEVDCVDFSGFWGSIQSITFCSLQA